MFVIFNDEMAFNLSNFYKMQGKTDESGKCYICFYGLMESPEKYFWVQVEHNRLNSILAQIFKAAYKGRSAVYIKTGFIDMNSSESHTNRDGR